MRSSGPLVRTGACAVLLVGCNALLGTANGEKAKGDARPNETSEEDGGTSLRPGEDGGVPREHPPDFACVRVIWAQGTDDPSCQARRVSTITKSIHAPGSLAIERTRSGRTVIAYPHPEGMEGGFVEVAQLTGPEKPTVTSIGTEGMSTYQMLALARLGADNVLLAYHWASAGTLSVVELGAKGAVRMAEDVVTNLSSSIYVDLATDANGAAHVAYFDPATKTLASKTKKNAAASWSSRTEIDKGFVVDGPAGSGQVSLAVDDLGNSHVAYNKATSQALSSAFYKAAVDGRWGSLPRTVEMGGTTGYGITLGVFGEERFTAYYAPGTLDRYRQLHFASWSGTSPSSNIILDDSIRVDDPLTPNTAVAMAVDDFGWVHLVTAFPTGYDTEIRYTRQALVDGKLRFITDTVDSLPVTEGVSPTLVAIVVDEKSRPHIAYHSGVDDTVHYATIYDE